MKTKFAEFDDDDIPRWALHFHAADAWLMSLYLLMDNRDESPWGIFYVEPTIIAFCVELLAKSIAAHEDSAFDARRYSHDTVKILNAYPRIPIFKETTDDSELLSVVAEYTKTINVRYGEVGVVIDRDERQRMIDLIHRLRAYASERTGLR